jgi:hypothetical protein
MRQLFFFPLRLASGARPDWKLCIGRISLHHFFITDRITCKASMMMEAYLIYGQKVTW